MKLRFIYLLIFFASLACKQEEQVVVTTTPAVANPYPEGGVSLLPDPGMKNPRLRFHDGGVENNAPRLFKELPDIPEYKGSRWFVAQWKKTEVLTPQGLVLNPSDVIDPRLGSPLYGFSAKNGLSRVSIFKENNKDTGKDSLVFELFSEGGWLDTDGGLNLFLSTELNAPNMGTLDSRIDLNFRAKISQRKTEYLASGAQEDGSVVSQFFTGFTLTYNDPNTKEVIPLFVQIAHADSRNPKFLPPGKLEYIGCYKNSLNQKQIVYGNNMANSLGGNGFIAGEDPAGELRSYSYNLNNQICGLVTKTIQCQDGSAYRFPEASFDLANWRIGSFYTGIETQEAFALNASIIPTVSGPKRGNASLGVQISDLQLMKYPAEVSSLCGGATRQQVCANGATQACSTNGGQGSQSCSADGSKWGACSLKYCDEGSYLENGACLKLESNPKISSGKFCNGTNVVLWQCGQSDSPALDWVNAGTGCFHHETKIKCN